MLRRTAAVIATAWSPVFALIVAVPLFVLFLAYVGSRPRADAQASVTRELGDAGRVLIRPSGTEPLVRVMVEARDAAAAKACAERLAATLRT